MISLLLLFSILLFYHSGKSCRLPAGEWVQGDRRVTIQNDTFLSFGHCRAGTNHEYLLESNTSRGACFRCAMVFAVHENVLQYKLSGCVGEKEWPCRRQIPVDAPLHTLFRADAPSISCPVPSPVLFSFSSWFRGCSSRPSRLSLCRPRSSFRLSFQSCPETPNYPAHDDDYECIATWQDGSFLVGRRLGFPLEHRCFLISGSSGGGRIGVSADSGCHELTSIESATTILSYRQDVSVEAACRFPAFILRHARWTSLHGDTHAFTGGEWTEHSHELHSEVAHEGAGRLTTCLRHTDLGRTHVFVVHVVDNCHRYYQCVKIRREKSTVIQIWRGPEEAEEMDDCSIRKMKATDTLYLRGSEAACPVTGLFQSDTCTFSMGCQHPHHIQHDCLGINVRCGHHWQEGAITYLVGWNDTNAMCLGISGTGDGSSVVLSLAHSVCSSPSTSLPLVFSPCPSVGVFPSLISSLSSFHSVFFFCLLIFAHLMQSGFCFHFN